MAGIVVLKEGDNIPDSDHVVRYVRPGAFDEDIGVLEAAFELRENEKYLSVNWLEYFDRNDSEQMQCIRETIGINVRRNGLFAKLHVGEIKKRIEDTQVKYLPMSEPEDPSHAGIYFPQEQNHEHALELANMVLQDCIFPAIAD